MSKHGKIPALKILADIGKIFFKHKYICTIVAFAAIVGFFDPNSFWERYKLSSQNNELREEIARYRTKYRRDSIELRQLQTSPEALEQVARVHHFMKTDNEDIYVMEEN